MGYKYLEDANIDLKVTPYGWGANEDPREDKWKKEREIYGFDERETWSMDSTFICWLYQRLKMFNEVNCIDTKNPHQTFEFENEDGEIINVTLQDCIDNMIELCELYYEGNSNQEDQIIETVLGIFSECIRYLWW